MSFDRLTIEGKKTFKVMVNPEEFSIKNSIEYSDSFERRSPKFAHYGTSVIAVPKIFLDTTGAIPVEQWPIKGASIDEMITELKKIVYDYDGDSHEPAVVKVTWGSNNFKGRLLSMNTKFTLFDKAGSPLRAEIELEFSEFLTLKEIEAKANKHSPDLTHIIEVKSGDTLPNLCNKVYKDPSYYIQVARINGLSSFCRLKPGTRLVFPPLVD